MRIKEDKDYQYPNKEEIVNTLNDLWENNNDIQMILWKKYFKVGK